MLLHAPVCKQEAMKTFRKQSCKKKKKIRTKGKKRQKDEERKLLRARRWRSRKTKVRKKGGEVQFAQGTLTARRPKKKKRNCKKACAFDLRGES